MREWRLVLPSVVLAAGLVLGATSPTSAGAPTDHLKTQIDRVIKTLEDPDLRKESRARERRTAVRRIAEEVFDFAETAKRSLGRHWLSRSAAEREEFVRLFTDLLERSYLTKIEVYGGERVHYLSDTVDGDNATVRTKIMTKHGSEIPIDYKMLRKASRWLVYDVSIEGISLIGNYRTQFNKIIQTSSYQELVKKLKTKQEEFLEEEKQRRTSLR